MGENPALKVPRVRVSSFSDKPGNAVPEVTAGKVLSATSPEWRATCTADALERTLSL